MPVVVKGLSGSAVAISGGENDTCALISGGAVECWQSTPVAVSGLQHDVVAISDSGLQTCALLRGGAVKCWGINDHGQLGNGTTKDSWTPVAVARAATRCGRDQRRSDPDDHACALLRDGTVRCWGENEFGQLGDGTTQQRATPVKVQGLRDVATVVVNQGYGRCRSRRCFATTCWSIEWRTGRRDGLVFGRTRDPRFDPAVLQALADTARVEEGGA